MVDISYLNSGLITLGVAFMAYNQYRNNQSILSVSTTQILKDNIAAKDIEITQMKADHDKAIAELKSQIATLTVQILDLKRANDVLQTTVSGRDILVSIQEVLKPIPNLFISGGYLEQAAEDQQKILKILYEIRGKNSRNKLDKPNSTSTELTNIKKSITKENYVNRN